VLLGTFERGEKINLTLLGKGRKGKKNRIIRKKGVDFLKGKKGERGGVFEQNEGGKRVKRSGRS